MSEFASVNIKNLEIVAKLTVGSSARQESAIPLHYLHDFIDRLARGVGLPRMNPGDGFDCLILRPAW